MRDYRDLVIAQFADDERQLLERLASAEDDRDAYRALAQQAIHSLHDLTARHERLRELHARLADDYRHLRVQLLTKVWAA